MSYINHIKNEARRIKKKHGGLTHYQALDIAARNAGFNSWNHLKSIQNGKHTKDRS